MKKSREISVLAFIDEYIIEILLTGFAFVIPLLFKIPLLNVNYTYVAIRFEDFYIALLCAVFFIQLIRKKLVLSQTLLRPILFFWSAVFLSYVVGYYITHTITIENRLIAPLHAARRVEYMIVFFIMTSLITSKKSTKLFYYFHGSNFFSSPNGLCLWSSSKVLLLASCSNNEC